MTTRTVSVELQAKVGQYSSAMNRAAADTRAVDSAAQGTIRSSKMSGAAMAAAGIAAGVAAKGMWESVQAASDLNETVSKVGVIFGDGADKVEAFGDTAADTIGQSKRVALDGAATFGVFGKSAGLAGDDLADFSTEFVTLASDLASFNNTSPEDAIEAIGAALRGEQEPIRRYGVLLDDATLRQEAMRLGLVKTTKEALTPQNKVLAARAQIFAQTSDAQGDFARTSDGLANSQRTLAARFEDTKASLGTIFLPMVQSAVGSVNGLLGAFTELEPETQRNVIQIGLFGTAAAVAVPKVIDLAGTVSGMASNFDIAKARTVSLTLAVAAIGAAFIVGANDASELTGELDRMVDAFERGGDGATLQKLSGELANLRTQAREMGTEEGFWSQGLMDGFKQWSYRLSHEGRDVVDDIADYEDKISQFGKDYDAVMQAVSARTGISVESVKMLADKTGVDLTAGVGAATESLTGYIYQNVLAKSAADRSRSSQEVLNDEYATAEDRLKAYADLLDKLNGKNLTAEETNDRLEASIDDANEALKENGRTLDDGTAKGRANRQTLRDIARAASDHAQALLDLTGDQDQANGALRRGRDALIDQARKFGMSRTSAEKYADAVLKIPAVRNTKVTADTSAAEVTVQNFIKWVNGQKVKIVGSVSWAYGSGVPRGGGPNGEWLLPGRHTGGKIMAGRAYAVGERGPETLQFDRGGLSGTVTAGIRPANTRTVAPPANGGLSKDDMKSAVTDGVFSALAAGAIGVDISPTGAARLVAIGNKTLERVR